MPKKYPPTKVIWVDKEGNEIIGGPKFSQKILDELHQKVADMVMRLPAKREGTA